MSSSAALTDGRPVDVGTNVAPLLSFGAFADAHYAHRIYGSRYCQDSLSKLRACVETFSARSLPLAINLGDLIDAELDIETERASLAAMCEAYARFRGTRSSVAGNHDLGTLTKCELLEALSRSRCGLERARAYGSLEVNDVHLTLLDSNCHRDGSDFGRGSFQWYDAWISEEQVTWLARDLEAARERQAIVLCHGCLGPPPNGESDPHTVRNAAAVRSVLERAGNVCAVVQAHYHPGMLRVLNGIPYFGLAAMVEGPGLENNAYAVVSLYEDGYLAVEGFGRQGSLGIRA